MIFFLSNEYHENFGKQWNRFNKLQLDSFNGSNESSDRILNQSELTKNFFEGKTVLEIGAGKSTLVISDAIQKNKIEFGDYVKANLRKNNPFELHSVETSDYWAKEVEKTIPSNLKEICTIHISKCRMNIFNSRVCTSFDNLPNICPDFIYLDGPDQYSVEGDIDGITTSHPDRMPMVSDILRIEPFLLPGTVILVDGRTCLLYTSPSPRDS